MLILEKKNIYFTIELKLREISSVVYVNALICARQCRENRAQ